jgi:hypothetical protein
MSFEHKCVYGKILMEGSVANDGTDNNYPATPRLALHTAGFGQIMIAAKVTIADIKIKITGTIGSFTDIEVMAEETIAFPATKVYTFYNSNFDDIQVHVKSNVAGVPGGVALEYRCNTQRM